MKKLLLTLGILILLGTSYAFAVGTTTVKTSGNAYTTGNLSQIGKFANGLAGLWTFNGSDLISNVRDASVNGNNGTLVGFAATTTTIGKIGQALVFDGVDDCVNLGNPSALQITGDITLSAWVKISAQPADNSAFQIVAKDKDTGGRGYNLDYVRIDGNPTEAGLRIYVDGGSGTYLKQGVNMSLTVGEWYHIVGTYETSGGTARLYINGALNKTQAGGATAIPNATANARIGCREYPGFLDYMNGSIDDVRIHNRALTAGEIYNLYNDKVEIDAGTFTPDDIPGLALWYKADSINPSTTAIDQWTDLSGNGRHADQTGGGASRPSYSSNWSNGQPAVSFNGSTNFFNVLNPFYNTSWTFFAAFEATNGTSAYFPTLTSTSAIGGIYTPFVYTGTTYVLEETKGGAIAGENGSGKHRWAATGVPGTVTMWKDGVLQGLSDSSAASTGNWAYLGKRNTDNVFATGYMGEIILYSRELTAAERDQLENYLIRKYGL